MKHAAICIATYRRPEGLQALLGSLITQQVPDGWKCEVRVVNNDPHADRERWEAAVAEAYPGAVTAFEPRRNIAHARNTAIAIGRADAYLFIDDDEVPAEGWLAALISRLEDADAVFGPVVGRVPDKAPRWLVRSGVFDKPGPDHDGNIGWNLTRTSSTAVSGRWIGLADRWFAADYGTSGGSDVEFFRRIAGEGARFVHERRALVYEDVEPDRCTWKAVLRRRYRAGAVHGRMERAQSQSIRHLLAIKRVVAGAGFCIAGLVPLCCGRPGVFFHGICKAAVGVGAWRGHNNQYRVTRYPSGVSLEAGKGGAACALPS